MASHHLLLSPASFVFSGEFVSLWWLFCVPFLPFVVLFPFVGFCLLLRWFVGSWWSLLGGWVCSAVGCSFFCFGSRLFLSFAPSVCLLVVVLFVVIFLV
jgi:hypothetical protein